MKHPGTNVVYLEKVSCGEINWCAFCPKNETYIVVYFIGILKCGLKKLRETFLWVHSKHVIF